MRKEREEAGRWKGRKEGKNDLKVIHTQVTLVTVLMRLPREAFQKELLTYVLPRDELGK